MICNLTLAIDIKNPVLQDELGRNVLVAQVITIKDESNEMTPQEWEAAISKAKQEWFASMIEEMVVNIEFI